MVAVPSSPDRCCSGLSGERMRSSFIHTLRLREGVRAELTDGAETQQMVRPTPLSV
ncbi:hypothetical protein ABVT39_001743 [Epinephelus coioides]